MAQTISLGDYVIIPLLLRKPRKHIMAAKSIPKVILILSFQEYENTVTPIQIYIKD